MAEYKKIVDYLESPLGYILQEEYDNAELKDIRKETKLPLWLLNDLSSCGYLDNMDEKSVLVLNTLSYCFKNHRFLKSAVGNLSRRDKSRLFREKKDTQLRLWIKTKVFNLKTDKQKVSVKSIYSEICTYFPNIEEQGYQGYKDIEKYINNATRQYNRQQSNKK